MVTISAEFVANEQMNNCVSGDAEGPRGGAPLPSPALPVPTPTAAAAESPAASSDEEDQECALDPVPAPVEQPKANKKLNDNHQPGKNQRSKQKRPHDSHKPAAKTPSKPEAPAAPPAQVVSPLPSAPVAEPAAPVPSPAPAPSSPAHKPPMAPTSTPYQPAPLQQNSHPTPAGTGPARASPGASASAPNCSRRPGASPVFPHMEAVTRVLALPIVDSGVSMVTGVYSRVKNVNPVIQWSLGTAEGAVRSSLGRSLSLLGPLSGPLSVVDALLCRGLDMVEYSVPIITLPPELMMTASRDYMSMRVVAPVLRMTATNARLADTLAARALDSADHYVDKYLPGDAATENGDASVGPGAAFKRADRLSRKLQRRITRLTLAEARALRKDTENTLHTLVYFAETLVKDPRAFVEQCRAVWNHLSENEPENQVPPETLEERLALLVREVARRVVHLVNYTAASASTKSVSNVANHILKSVRVEGTKVMNFAHSQLERIHMQQVFGDVNIYTHQLLERLAHLLAGLRNSSNSIGRRFPHADTNNIAIVN